jgi:hypothetical protein
VSRDLLLVADNVRVIPYMITEILALELLAQFLFLHESRLDPYRAGGTIVGTLPDGSNDSLTEFTA